MLSPPRHGLGLAERRGGSRADPTTALRKSRSETLHASPSGKARGGERSGVPTHRAPCRCVARRTVKPGTRARPCRSDFYMRWERQLRHRQRSLNKTRGRSKTSKGIVSFAVPGLTRSQTLATETSKV